MQSDRLHRADGTMSLRGPGTGGSVPANLKVLSLLVEESRNSARVARAAENACRLRASGAAPMRN